MEMNSKKKWLSIYAIMIPIFMVVLFWATSKLFTKTLGYFLPYGIYLVILLVGIVCFRIGRSEAKTEIKKHQYEYYFVAFIPVVATFIVAFLPTIKDLKLGMLLLLLVYSIVNGLLEEMFWRFSFNELFGENILRAYIVPTILFSCWHVALLFAKGVTYSGGAPALVGGAAFMGVLWGFVMFKTKNIKIVIIAHVLTNFFAFSQLLYDNWFAK